MKRLFFKLSVAILALLLTGCQEHYFGEDIDEAQKIATYNDAVYVRNAAVEYCVQNSCSSTEELTWIDITSSVTEIDVNETDYDLTANNGIVAQLSNGTWKIYLEKDGTGSYEFPQGGDPIALTSQDVVVDNN